jgi:hypothetical protein
VHYPLPLAFVEAPTIDELQATIKRLRAELQDARADTTAEGRRVREENAELRTRVRRLEKQLGAQNDSELRAEYPPPSLRGLTGAGLGSCRPKTASCARRLGGLKRSC